MPQVPFYPDQASTFAGEVDALYTFLVALSVVFGAGIAAALVSFAVKYRRAVAGGRPVERPGRTHCAMALDLARGRGPLVTVLGIFAWGALLFYKIQRPPKNAMEIHVVGKRWMWKVQHMTGQREINELHVPIGVP